MNMKLELLDLSEKTRQSGQSKKYKRIKRRSLGFTSLLCLTLLTALTQAAPQRAALAIPVGILSNQTETVKNSMKNSNDTSE